MGPRRLTREPGKPPLPGSPWMYFPSSWGLGWECDAWPVVGWAEGLRTAYGSDSFSASSLRR